MFYLRFSILLQTGQFSVNVIKTSDFQNNKFTLNKQRSSYLFPILVPLGLTNKCDWPIGGDCRCRHGVW
jgi:hypothetical protein